MEEGRGLNVITIPMEEYKELLIIKGKYEELKSQELYKKPCTNSPTLIRDFPQNYEPSKTNITCKEKGLQNEQIRNIFD